MVISCPLCGEFKGINSTLISESQLAYSDKEGDHTHHFGPLLDCHCRNCDAEWLLLVEGET